MSLILKIVSTKIELSKYIQLIIHLAVMLRLLQEIKNIHVF